MDEPFAGKQLCHNCGEPYPQYDGTRYGNNDPFCPECMALLKPRENHFKYEGNLEIWRKWTEERYMASLGLGKRGLGSGCPYCGHDPCTREHPDCQSLRRKA